VNASEFNGEGVLFDAVGLPAGVREGVVREVQAVYRWIDRCIVRAGGSQRPVDGSVGDEAGVSVGCRACGRCCDFEAYDHRLFVTLPEVVYFAAMMEADGSGPVRRMVGGVCPYREGALCAVHKHRFAGCRIFCCSGPMDAAAQGALSERAIRCFKAICRRYGLAYRYMDLKAALNSG